ncbi:hypothetical protein SNEBB_002651 [Seison nebaliae]|nr:hypothetical protein SNEBB_002651 [Seison nebaliae]
MKRRKRNEKKLKFLNERYGIHFSDSLTNYLVIGNMGMLFSHSRQHVSEEIISILNSSQLLNDNRSTTTTTREEEEEDDNNNNKIMMKKKNLRMEEIQIIMPFNSPYILIKFPTVELTELFLNFLIHSRYGSFVHEDVWLNEMKEKKRKKENVREIEGLNLLREVLKDEREIECLWSLFLLSREKHVQLNNRTVLHFGKRFNYSDNSATTINEAIPQILLNLIRPYSSQLPNQCTINAYRYGDQIPPHVDDVNHYDGTIFSFSLGESISINFQSIEDNSKKFSLILPNNSLLIMRGDSRYKWKHSIKMDYPQNVFSLTQYHDEQFKRLSFTFRRFSPNIPNVDSDLILSDRLASVVEERYVREVYEQIASHFSDTRHSWWGVVQRFLQRYLKYPFVTLIDVGCGNGKYMRWKLNEFNPNSFYHHIGIDFSRQLLNEAKREMFEESDDKFTCHSFDLIQGNSLNMSLVSGCGDVIISIAVLHHISTTPRRIQFLNELMRLLSTDGKALITVWSNNQQHSTYATCHESNETKRHQTTSCHDDNASMTVNEKAETVRIISDDGAKESEILLPIQKEKKSFNFDDNLVPWKRKITESSYQTFLRYYHVFEMEEIYNLIKLHNEQHPNRHIHINDLFWEEGNWCFILSHSNKSILIGGQRSL